MRRRRWRRRKRIRRTRASGDAHGSLPLPACGERAGVRGTPALAWNLRFAASPEATPRNQRVHRRQNAKTGKKWKPIHRLDKPNFCSRFVSRETPPRQGADQQSISTPHSLAPPTDRRCNRKIAGAKTDVFPSLFYTKTKKHARILSVFTNLLQPRIEISQFRRPQPLPTNTNKLPTSPLPKRSPPLSRTNRRRRPGEPLSALQQVEKCAENPVASATIPRAPSRHCLQIQRLTGDAASGARLATFHAV